MVPRGMLLAPPPGMKKHAPPPPLAAPPRSEVRIIARPNDMGRGNIEAAKKNFSFAYAGTAAVLVLPLCGATPLPPRGEPIIGGGGISGGGG